MLTTIATTTIKGCKIACTKKKKSLNFASSGSWHLKVGMETPENDFQIYRPINDPWHAVFIFGPFKSVKRAPNGSKNMISKIWLDTRPKISAIFWHVKTSKVPIFMCQNFLKFFCWLSSPIRTTSKNL